ncbi:MAG: LamG domain-containing protein [Candidatus Poribacteria bacterium]|nr:LamG domain-containing protein [Candidatus Poribacteria bacterium]
MTRVMRLMTALVVGATITVAASAAYDPNAVVAIYLFDSVDDGIAIDSSGNGNDAAILNGVGLANGKFGSAFDFSAAAAHAVFAPLPYSDSVTIAMWAQPRAFTSNNIGLAHVLTGTQDNADVNSKTIGVWLENTGLLWGRIIPSGAANVNFPKNGTLALGTWYHVAMVVDAAAGAAIEYVDGVEVGRVDYPGALNNFDHVNIGRQGTESWDGLIDEVFLVSAALSSDDLANVMLGLSLSTSVDATGKLASSWGSLKQDR